jgi:hypothetical protein
MSGVRACSFAQIGTRFFDLSQCKTCEETGQRFSDALVASSSDG